MKKCNHGMRTVDVSKIKNGCMQCELERDILAEVAELYFERTGQFPAFSFWGWLDSMSIEPTKDVLLDILNNPNNYLDEAHKEK